MSEIQNPSNPYRTTPEASAASPAGFWRRLAAYILDGILIGIVAEVIEHIVKLGISDATPSGRLFLISGITVIVGIIYFTALWTARNGQSLGYQALGIRLIKADGSNPGVGANFLRSIVLYIS
ncbi:MAG: RDD family protein, partial [Candidatus Dormibacteraceae bacterium]